MRGRNQIANILRVLEKAFFWLLGLFLFILLVLILFLQTPPIQKWVTDKVLAVLNEQGGKDIRVGSIRISWLDAIKIQDLEVYDYKGNLMVAAHTLKVDYSLTELVENGRIIIEEIDLKEGELHLVKYPDSLGINLSEWLKSPTMDTAKAESGSKLNSIYVGQVNLTKMVFSYQNMLKDSLPAPLFDFGHFSVTIGDAQFSGFSMVSDSISLSIDRFNLIDSVSGFRIDQLHTKALLTNGGLELQDFELKTPNSTIRDRLSLSFSGLEDLGYFTDSVSFDIQLKNSVLSPEDANFFVAGLPPIQPVSISAAITGTVGSLDIANLALGTGQTTLLGRAFLLGLPRIDETFIDLEVRAGTIYPKDLKPFLGEFWENVRQLGTIQLSGQFSGFVTDFVANAVFKTEHGAVHSDINLKIPTDWQHTVYSGKLKLDQFNLGRFLKNRALVQTLNFDGTIDGSGLTTKTADFNVAATLLNSGFYGHEYQRIEANGRFATEYFDGKLIVQDTAFKIESRGNIDLKRYPEHIQVSADIKHIDFKKLRFVTDEMMLKAKVDIEVSGLDFDSLAADVKLADVEFDYMGKQLKLESLSLVTTNKNGLRIVDFTIPEVSASLQGNFLYSQLFADMSKLKADLASYFQVLKIAEETTPIVHEYGNFQIDFDLKYGDLTPYLAFLPFELYVSPNGAAEGTYYQRDHASLSFFTDIDSMHYQGIGFDQITIEVNLAKKLDSLGILGIFYLASQKQTWRSIPETTDLEVEALWLDNRLEVSSKIKQPATKSKADLNTTFFLEPDILAFQIGRSTLTVLGEQWRFDPENRIEFADNTLSIFNLSLQNQFQSISISGLYSDSLFTDMRIFVQELDMASLSLIIPTQIAGTLDGEFEILKLEEEGNHQLNSKIDILNLTVDGYYVGNLMGHSMWHPDKKGIFMDYKIERKSINTIRLFGYYYPEKEEQLDLTAKFDEANLGLAAPFVEGLFSDLKGTASGEIKIAGKTSLPSLNGSAKINNGGFKFDYLGTPFTFDGEVKLDDRTIALSNFRLRDQEGNAGTLSGVVNHENFSNISTNIKIGFNKMNILNTNAKMGELYYGTAYATGSLQILGPLDDLSINAKLKSNAGTKIYIPLESTGEVEQKDYISFVDLSDTTRDVAIEQVVQKSVSGMSLNFDLEVTPDAYVELIFDIRAGDIIRGRAEGNINLRLNTDGQFEMFGDVSITEGAYNFTIPSMAFNKEFNVQPGSTISWYGDPYAGVVNLHATYRQMASLSDYRAAAQQEEEVAQRLPFLVILDLKGDMLSPQIGFQIKLDESQASVSTEEQAEINAININEQELKRQVFGLLILRKFLPENNFVVSSNDISGSISEFLSNQFSYFISQVDENLEVDVDLAGMDQDAFNTFQLRLSYTFLNGRLKVTGGGGIPQDSESSSSFIGDWSLRYLLTKDGHFRIKAFSQTDNIAGALQRETGVSFQYLKSFDDLQELLRRTSEETKRRQGLQTGAVNASGI